MAPFRVSMLLWLAFAAALSLRAVTPCVLFFVSRAITIVVTVMAVLYTLVFVLVTLTEHMRAVITRGRSCCGLFCSVALCPCCGVCVGK